MYRCKRVNEILASLQPNEMTNFQKANLWMHFKICYRCRQLKELFSSYELLVKNDFKQLSDQYQLELEELDRKIIEQFKKKGPH